MLRTVKVVQSFDRLKSEINHFALVEQIKNVHLRILFEVMPKD